MLYAIIFTDSISLIRLFSIKINVSIQPFFKAFDILQRRIFAREVSIDQKMNVIIESFNSIFVGALIDSFYHSGVSSALPFLPIRSISAARGGPFTLT
jgi:hypothetical protein